MTWTNYGRGKHYEKRTREWLEKKGYFVVEARGSHGAVDLVALGADGVIAVQVKSGRKLSARERGAALEALLAVPMPENGRRWMVTWTKHAREPLVWSV